MNVLFSLAVQVIQKFMLRKGQDITAMALNTDNSNLVVSTADKQLLIFTDPAVSSSNFETEDAKVVFCMSES